MNPIPVDYKTHIGIPLALNETTQVLWNDRSESVDHCLYNEIRGFCERIWTWI